MTDAHAQVLRAGLADAEQALLDRYENLIGELEEQLAQLREDRLRFLRGAEDATPDAIILVERQIAALREVLDARRPRWRSTPAG